MQQPPPEEKEAMPAPPTNATELVAYRLVAANTRESRARSVQVDGRVERLAQLGSRSMQLWYRIARYLIRADVKNIERYVHAQYRHVVCKDKDNMDETLSQTLCPGTFDTERAHDRYRRYDDRADKIMASKLESLYIEFECCVGDAATTFTYYSDKQLWNYVLMNKMLDLPPLFRYCIAASAELREPMTAYRSSAMEQYLTDPIGYSRVWGRAIPKELNDESTSILTFDPQERSWK